MIRHSDHPFTDSRPAPDTERYSMAFSWFKHKKKPERKKYPVESDTGSRVSSADISAPDPESIPEHIPTAPIDSVANATGRPEASGFLDRLKHGLAKTRESFSSELEKIFSGKQIIDEALLEELEDLLITSDIGVQTALSLIENLSSKSLATTDTAHLKAVLKEEILSLLITQPADIQRVLSKPYVSMVVGVNGVGKTTTIGKIAAKSVIAGKKVLIAAADTFRAAAIEQLAIWAQRAGAEIVRHKDNADPSAVVFDSIEAALARDIDLVLVDTAGRLHTKINLMEELKKIKRTIAKKLPDAPHEILLILDATTGQNALSQAELFNEALGITGLAITKLDGTAKGGIVISISNSLNIPIKYIGVGEKIEDLQTFNPQLFVDALF